MTISSGFFEVLFCIFVSKWIWAAGEERRDLHRGQTGRSPDVVEDVAESFLGHLVFFGGIYLKNIGCIVREMWSVGRRSLGFYIGPGACEERGLGYPAAGQQPRLNRVSAGCQPAAEALDNTGPKPGGKAIHFWALGV